MSCALLPKTIEFLEKVAGSVQIDFGPTKNLSGFNEIVKDLSEAATSRKRVEIDYRAVSTGKLTKRKVDPYKVWIMSGAFYLIGQCKMRDAIRTFAMDRIQNYKDTDESFEIPADFKLEDYLQTAFRVMRGKPEKVTFRLAPGAAHVVKERIWHPTQELRETEGGGVEISYQFAIFSGI